MKIGKSIIFVLSLVYVFLFLPLPLFADEYGKREEVKEFAENMAQEHGFELNELMIVLSKAEYKQSIIDAISRPAEKVMVWSNYQDIFLTKSRAKGGRKFLRENRKTLERAEKRYGVPAEIIVAVIGVETRYGELKGKFRVLDALMTLGFDYPPRSVFFKSELKEFLLLAREEAAEPDSLLGSYAGAMGYGQFISSSFRHYAVDFDDDGIRDIWNNPVDAIGSVANYLGEHGWIKDAPIIERAFNVTEDARLMFSDALKPEVIYASMKVNGVRTKSKFGDEALVSPLLFKGKKGHEYWIGLNNFYVITRYNRSKLYAMAIFQLSQSISGKN